MYLRFTNLSTMVYYDLSWIVAWAIRPSLHAHHAWKRSALNILHSNSAWNVSSNLYFKLYL
jgi:hypothetical protein